MTTVASQIREAAKSLYEFSPADIADAINLQTFRDRRRIKNMLRDFLRRGEMERIAPGRYRYNGKAAPRTKMDIIWHLIRSHRRFTAAELERLSGAKRNTVREYLRCLQALGYLAKRNQEIWALVDDPGPETPANTAKCEKLKRIRRQKANGGKSKAEEGLE